MNFTSRLVIVFCSPKTVHVLIDYRLYMMFLAKAELQKGEQS